MSGGRHRCIGHRNAGTAQTLDELDFERGIWYAAQWGDLERVCQLAPHGCSDVVDRRDAAGYTALHYAARNGRLEVCKYLVERGANVDAVTKGGASAMCRAASAGKIEIVQYLLSKGANPLINDSDRKTALHRAAENGHTEISKLLLDVAPDLQCMTDISGRKAEDYEVFYVR